MAQLTKKEARQRRHKKIRKRLSGTPEKPRLAVYRSEKHIYVQFVDDINGHTLVSASTLESAAKDGAQKATTEHARKVAQLAAERAQNQNITKAVFDRGGFKFHGKVKIVAETVREAGLKL